jgi:hypothetical protein
VQTDTTDIYRAMVEGLQAAAAGEFQPRFYRVKVSPRRERRYRRPGMASWLSPAEARAVQAFYYFAGCSIGALARRFHRNRRTIRKALSDPAFRYAAELE